MRVTFLLDLKTERHFIEPGDRLYDAAGEFVGRYSHCTRDDDGNLFCWSEGDDGSLTAHPAKAVETWTAEDARTEGAAA